MLVACYNTWEGEDGTESKTVAFWVCSLCILCAMLNIFVNVMYIYMLVILMAFG